MCIPVPRGLGGGLDAIALNVLHRATHEARHLSRVRRDGKERGLALAEFHGAASKGVKAIGVENDGDFRFADDGADEGLGLLILAEAGANGEDGFALAAAAKRLDSRFTAAMLPSLVARSGSVMYSACAAATTPRAGSGTATVTSPAPARRAASEAMIAAPAFPTDPAMTSTCPKRPLLESGQRSKGKEANSRGSTQRMDAPPISSMSEPGEPILATVRRPTLAAFTETSWPTLGAVKVTVSCACKTGPAAGSPSEGRPEGVSIARISAGRADCVFRERRLISSMARAARPVAAPRSPVPSSPSTITSAAAMAGHADCHAPSF